MAIVATLLIGVFEGLRGLLLWRYQSLAVDIPSDVLLKSFLVGFRFDLSITGYILAPAALIGLAPGIGLESSRITRRIVAIYLTVMGAIAFLMSVSDLEFFGVFNTRLNYLAVAWIDTPVMVVQMLWEMFTVVPYLVGWILLSVIFGWIVIHLSGSMFQRFRQTFPMQQWLIYPLALILIFGAIRGRVAIKAPLTWGVAYFSPYHFANQLALNSCFTFTRDILDHIGRDDDDDLPYLIPSDQAFSRARQLLDIDSTSLIGDHPVARIEDNGIERRLNVIVVLMESLSADMMDSCRATGRSLTPEFDRIAAEGLLFNRFYSNGGHTFTGIFSTTTGLPSPPGKSLMKRSEGQQSFAGLGTLLKERGYHTRCYVTHDPHFDNMKGFLIGNGFDEVIGQHQYPADQVVSSLGVPDEVMFDRVLDDLDEMDEPFFVLLLTGSSHGPYIHPDRPFPHTDPSHPEADRFNAFSYSDWAFGQFYDGVRNALWGDSTLFVALGDHGVIRRAWLELDPSLFRVPLLIVCPPTEESCVSGLNRIIRKIGNQKDVTATVMGILGGQWINNTLGRNLLRSVEPDYPGGSALFIEGNGFGYVYDDYYLVRNRNGRLTLYRLPDLTPASNQTIQQQMTTDAVTWLSATHHLIKLRLVGIPIEPDHPATQ